MNIKELRIGNYVRNQDGSLTDTPIGKPVKIEDYKHIMWAELCVPIQLTEEWLLKFGFENIDYGFTKKILTVSTLQLIWSDGWIYPQIIEEPEMSNETVNVVSLNRIKSVHQLQNLYFALTGKELQYNS